MYHAVTQDNGKSESVFKALTPSKLLGPFAVAFASWNMGFNGIGFDATGLPSGKLSCRAEAAWSHEPTGEEEEWKR